jgi:hypothetical protein
MLRCRKIAMPGRGNLFYVKDGRPARMGCGAGTAMREVTRAG